MVYLKFKNKSALVYFLLLVLDLISLRL